MKLLFEYRFIIMVVLAIILYAALEWQKFKSQSYALMLQAKSLAKDAILKSGSQQEEWVIRKAYQFLPKKITLFINEQRMRNIVHYLYNKAKDFTDDGE
ncbi:hypothetical protein [Clostridium sp. CF012]|uniref:hypothetical protein n=1 Tax=Clostridium sp. CF012 TaxID=2843319 RepID=UPI001C0DCF99|nr:hypothetical protein [Clostridium sp. CF012]MBU3146911.1 hypothetical protein [Clostridium sp. CF012]